MIAFAFFVSASVFANTVLTIDTTIDEGRAAVVATNLSGVDLICDYKIKWSTSLLGNHLSWGSVGIPAAESVTVLIEDMRGLSIKKVTPQFNCEQN